MAKTWATGDQVNAADLNMMVCPAGAILAYAGASAPSNWLLCNGQAVSRVTYADLFAVIGTTYGVGDGSTTFNVPDMRGNVPAGYKAADGSFGTLGAAVGEKTHLLDITEVPAHSHNIKTSGGGVGDTHLASQISNGGGFFASENAGGGVAHNNIQPSLVVNFIIRY